MGSVAELICGEGYRPNWDALNAIATFLAVLASLCLAFFIPRYERWLDSGAKEAENRRIIGGFISELHKAVESTWLNCVLCEAGPIEGDPPFEQQIIGAGALSSEKRATYGEARANHLLFDDETGGRLVEYVDAVLAFERACNNLSARYFSAATDQARNMIVRSFENARGAMRGRASDFAPLLVRYGIKAEPWHANFPMGDE